MDQDTASERSTIAPIRPGDRVAVTGAAGLIGRSVIDELAVDFDMLPITRSPANFPSRVVDLSDLSTTAAALEGAAAVVHLAAAAVLDASWDDVLRDNIVATHNVLEGARRAGCRRVVLASSHHVLGMYEEDWAPSFYDLDDPRTLTVDSPPRPDSLYAVSKLFAENLGRFYHERFGLDVVCIRIGVVRPDDDPTSADVAVSAPWLDLSSADRYARARAVWLSKRDAAALVRTALTASVDWAVIFGTSDNPRQLWDPTPARSLGYGPRDGSPRTTAVGR